MVKSIIEGKRMMRILITGSNGQLGTELKTILKTGKSELGVLPQEYNGCGVTAIDVDTLDITDRKAVDDYLREGNFSILFNCAAMTNVDACESKEDLAYQINAVGPENLAVSCKKYGCRLVHVSTDYVFHGDSLVPYTEEDIPNPTTAYGRTKLAGEEKVLIAYSEAVICRTAWLYGYHGNNFVKKIMTLAKEKGTLKVVTDQKGNPTCAVDLAWEIVHLAILGQSGIFHCTCNGEVASRYDFTGEILKDASIHCDLRPCLTADFPRAAKAPANSNLSKAKLDSIHLNLMRDWKTALYGWMQNYLEKERQT